MNLKGFLIVLSGPSGTGKNTLINNVMPHIPNLQYSISATTRQPRPGEKQGKDYFFISDAKFDRMVAAGDFLEWAEFVGNRYGTPRSFIEEKIDQKQTVIMDVDIQGALQIKQKMPEAVLVFLLPPTWEELKIRLNRRGKDSNEVITRRLQHSYKELNHIIDYDYFIINDQLDKAVERLITIIKAEWCRVARVDLNSIHRLWQRRS